MAERSLGDRGRSFVFAGTSWVVLVAIFRSFLGAVLGRPGAASFVFGTLWGLIGSFPGAPARPIGGFLSVQVSASTLPPYMAVEFPPLVRIDGSCLAMPY